MASEPFIEIQHEVFASRGDSDSESPLDAKTSCCIFKKWRLTFGTFHSSF